MKQSNLKNIRGLILDMDGVLWRHNVPIGNLPDIFAAIKQKPYKVTLATNNASLSIEQNLEKLKNFGVSLQPHEVINSSFVMAKYLLERFPSGGNIFVIGTQGLKDALAQKGFHHNEENDNIIAVIVGMDRSITYDKLSQATLLIRSGVPFVATNADASFPTPQGLIPGVGALLACLQVASDQTPHVVGKPAPGMYIAAMERMGVHPEETLVVGDRLETDIIGAQEIGCHTALVLSGVTDKSMAKQWSPAPDIIAENLASVLEMMNAA